MDERNLLSETAPGALRIDIFRLTYLNFIVFTDWNTTHVVLLFQFFRQWSGHQLPTNVRWRREVALAVFAPIGGNVLVEFHFRLITVAR